MRASLQRFRLRPATRRIASGVSLSMVAGLLVVMAIRSDGTPVSEVDLNDGGVWVTNSERSLMARLNPQIEELELGLVTDSGQADVFQEATTVFMDNQSGSRSLRSVDVALGSAADPVELPESVVAAYGGDTIALLEASTGRVWVRTEQTVAGFTTEDIDPDATVARGGAIAVSPDGTVFALDRSEGQVEKIAIGESGTAEPRGTEKLGASVGEQAELTVVGDVPVVLDPAAGTVLRPGSDAVTIDTVSPSELRLQQPSTKRDDVIVAAVDGLWRLGLGGGEPERLERAPVDGSPAAPMVRDDCVHAAWADPTPEVEGYSRWCDDAEYFSGRLRDVEAGARLVFRANRKVVVLNDVSTGTSWLVQDDDIPKVDNWDDVDPNKDKRDLEVEVVREVERSDVNRDPKANPDKLGARPGQATLLPVTANDTDPDGDIVTITRVVTESGLKGDPVIVGQDTMVQVTFGPNDVGTSTLKYTINDGRGGEASTTAVVTVAPESSSNGAPELMDKRTMRMTVAQGQRTTAYLLGDWVDPDGDDMTIVEAESDGGQVEFRPDGTVTFIDDNAGTGAEEITVTVSDGMEETEETVTVEVVLGDDLAPELIADRAVGVAGSKILVEPLLNDRSPDGTPPRLIDVRGPAGLEIIEDPMAGTFTAQTSKPGTYYLDYQAATTATASSIIRLDVLPVRDNRPPRAVKDQGLIPPGGGSVLIDVLANDYDPDDDVLAVQEVSVPRDSGLKATLIEHRQLRVEATKELSGAQEIRYAVSDGLDTAWGSVVVRQAREAQANRPPVAAKDRVTVRAGAVASVPVLDNDHDPDGDSLSLISEGLVIPDEIDAMFVSADLIRFRAPAESGEYRATYSVIDDRGLKHSAELVIDVLPDTEKNNRAPQPKPIADRTVQGKAVKVSLGTTGADPDGDAVGFKGVVVAPQLGRIVGTGVDWIEYEPFPDAAGTDSFRIAVDDKYGARGTVDVRIGVIPRAVVNQAPVALDDVLHVRSDRDRTISYFVLGNDVDPDGDQMRVEDELQLPEGVEAETERGFVTLDIAKNSSKEVTTSVGYSVTDGLGGVNQAMFTVVADPDAPLHAPITRDDTADLAKVAGQRPGTEIPVDVLENDGDLDGSVEDLKLDAVDKDVSRVDGDKLLVKLAETDQVIAYQVTDADGQKSFGFVFVSGTDTVPPVIDPATIPKEVEAGQATPIPLADHVLVRADRTPLLTNGDGVVAIKSDGSKLFKDERTLMFTPDRGYTGPAAITFEVTDGTSANDKDGLTSLLTIPIDVTAGGNVAPVIRSTRIDVPADGEATLDLNALATDANDDDLDFEVTGGGDIVGHSNDSGTLTLTSKGGAKFGDTTTLKVTVDDGNKGTATGDVLVTIVSTDRKLISMPTIRVEGEAGKPTSVDIADHAWNPYPDKLLTVSSPVLESGQASAPSAKGTQVTVTPKAGVAGEVTVKFTVSDASGDPARDVVGRLVVSVVSEPDAPAKPTTSTVEARSVVLTWREPANNGAPITGYRVTGSNGFSQSCTITTCELTGLTPGKPYAFSVEAENRVGWSEKSPASDPVTPDKKPDKMSAPVVEIDPDAMDGKLTISWTPPNVEGSAITHYEIQTNNGIVTAGANERSKTIAGLVNGHSYAFRIRAINLVKDLQEFSEPSQAVKPFGKPLTMAAPQAQSLNDGLTGGGVRVTWTPADDNGDPVTHYRIKLYKGSALEQNVEVATGTFSREFSVANGHDYTFEVAAKNRAGYSDDSARSNAVNPYAKSTPVRNVQEVNEGDKTARISFTAPADLGGRPIKHYEVTTGAGPVVKQNATTIDIPFNSNNGPYTATITPITVNNGSEVRGDPATISGLAPFGKPGAPTGSGSAGYREVNFSWNGGTVNGRPIKRVEYRKDGGWATGTSTTWATAQGGDSRCIHVRAVSEGRSGGELVGDERQICGNAQARSVSVSKGTRHPSTSGYYIRVKADGLRDGQATIIFGSNCGSPSDASYTACNQSADLPSLTVSTSNGRIDQQTSRFYGFQGQVWITIRQSGSSDITSARLGGWCATC